ncbi:MAG TPA: carbonic anhydrase [Limnobacter sp.]|nr:carbonic anhydrase [Limnobacter sp.]
MPVLPDVASQSAVSSTSSLDDLMFSDQPLAPYIRANRAIAQSLANMQPNGFEALAQGQSPLIAWVGCVDSRSSPMVWMGAKLGDVIEARTVAGLVNPQDEALQAALGVAIHALQSSELMVSAHSHCAGVRAAMLNQYPPGTQPHLAQARRLVLQYGFDRATAQDVSDEDQTTMAKLCALEQARNAARLDVVSQRWHQGQPLKISAWIQNLGTGHLEHLGCDIDNPLEADQKVNAAIDRLLPGSRQAKA